MKITMSMKRLLSVSALSLALAAPSLAGAATTDHHELEEHRKGLEHRRMEMELQRMEHEMELQHRKWELEHRERMEKLDRYEQELELERRRWELEFRQQEMKLREREMDLHEMEVELRLRAHELEQIWMELEEEHEHWSGHHDEDAHHGHHDDHDDHHGRHGDHDEGRDRHRGEEDHHRRHDDHDDHGDHHDRHDERQGRHRDDDRGDRRHFDFNELETRMKLLADVAGIYERIDRAEAADELWALVEAAKLRVAGASREEVAEASKGGADLRRRIGLLRGAAALLRERGADERADIVGGLARYYKANSAEGGAAARDEQPREARRVDFSDLETRVRVMTRAAKLYEQMGWETAAGQLFPLVEAGNLQLQGASEDEINAAYEGGANLEQRVEHLRRAAGWMKERGNEEGRLQFGGLARYYYRMLPSPQTSGEERVRRAR